MSDQTLIVLAKDVRGKTLKLLDPLSEQDARFAAAGLKNSILWNAGHALVVVEHLAMVPLRGGTPSYPAGYYETFSWTSDPAKVTKWPTLAEVKQKLADQLETLVHDLEKVDEAKLSQIINPEKGRTLRWSILHGLHDEANHQGEIWLLRKLAGKK